MKTCKVCNQQKQETDFPLSRGKYRKRTCKECQKKQKTFKSISGYKNFTIRVKTCLICAKNSDIDVKGDGFCQQCYDFYVKANIEQADKLVIYKIVTLKFPFLFKWRHMIPLLKANEDEKY